MKSIGTEFSRITGSQALETYLGKFPLFTFVSFIVFLLNINEYKKRPKTYPKSFGMFLGDRAASGAGLIACCNCE
jgi:hypothetical protein